VGEVLQRSSNLLCSTRLREAKGLSFLNKGGVTYVTKKGVAEQGPCECASCVNTRFDDQGSRVDLAVTFIKEDSGFDHFGRG